MNRSAENLPSVEKTLREERIRHLHMPPPPCVLKGTPLRDAIRGMKTHKSGTVLVCSRERLVGIFTERDFLMKLLGRPIDYREPVERYMTAGPKALGPDDSLMDAMRWMTAGGFRHIPVVDPEGRPIGLLGARDLVDFIAEHFPAEVVNLPPRPHLTSVAPEGA